jgi:RHS repeat-associated protein
VSKSYKVYPGDKVKVEAFAKYYNPTSTASNLTGFAGALTGAFGVSSSSTGEALKAYNGLNSYGGVVAGGGGNGNNTAPKAFVNIIIFDKDYKFLDVAWQQVSTSAQQIGVNFTQHEYLMREYTVKEAGYAFVYVSNENATLVEGYFDDVVMTYTPTNVIQYNEYYPFGLQTASSWTRTTATQNNFLYNEASELNTTSGLYDLPYRTYDPVLGRMNGVDPLASKYGSLTPYNYAANDPVYWTDPSGADMLPFCSTCGGFGIEMQNGGGSGGESAGWGGYGSSGWANFLNGSSPLDLVSSWSPNFGGPMQYVDHSGNERHGMPSTIEWANNIAVKAGSSPVGLELYSPWEGEGNDGVYPGGWIPYNASMAKLITSKGYSLRTRNALEVMNKQNASLASRSNFEVLHSADDSFGWDWFKETTQRSFYLSFETSVIIIYNTNKKDWGTPKYGQAIEIIGKSRMVIKNDIGTTQFINAAFNPSNVMKEWINGAKDYHCGGCILGDSVFDKYRNTILGPDPNHQDFWGTPSHPKNRLMTGAPHR